jgi:membrane protease subunit HflK
MQDEIIIDTSNKFNFNLSKRNIIIATIVLLVLILIIPIFFTVQTEEVAVIQRFGKFVRIAEPGLNVRIPWGIETIKKVKVRSVFKEEFGFRTISSGITAKYSNKTYDDESLMLTGDLNIASVEWIVQYQIKDPVAFLFNLRNVQGTIRNLSEASMRQIVGDRSIDEVIILNRQEIAFEVHELLQKQLDYYDTGILVKTINLQNVVPPEPVQPAFNDVNSAMQEEEKIVNQARQEYNRIIPQARGQARQAIEEAHGYAVNRVNQAQGDADKFNSIYEQYRRATNVTKQRMYLETMEQILPKVEKIYIIDQDNKGILPFLDMGKGR